MNFLIVRTASMDFGLRSKEKFTLAGPLVYVPEGENCS